MLVDHLLKTKKEYENLKKQEIHDIFTEMNYIKIVFSMIWFMEILKILLKEQLQIKYYMLKHLILLKILNMMNIKEVLLQLFMNVLIKKFSSGSGFAIKQNQQLVEELSKAITRKLKKSQVYSSLKDNIWGADLADMQLTSKFNKRIHFLLCY